MTAVYKLHVVISLVVYIASTKQHGTDARGHPTVNIKEAIGLMLPTPLSEHDVLQFDELLATELRQWLAGKDSIDVMNLPAILDDVLSVRVKDHLYLNLSQQVTTQQRTIYQHGLCEAVFGALEDSLQPKPYLLSNDCKQHWLVGYADLGLLRCFELTVPLMAGLSAAVADTLLASTFRRCDTALLEALSHLAAPVLYHPHPTPFGLRTCSIPAMLTACAHESCLKDGSATCVPANSLRRSACAILTEMASTSSLSKEDHLECQTLLPTLHVQTQREDMLRNIAQGRPMLVTGLVPVDYQFNKTAFLTINAEQDMQVSGIPYGDVFGLDAGLGTIAEMQTYIHSLPQPQRPVADVLREHISLNHHLVTVICGHLASTPLYVFDAQAEGSFEYDKDSTGHTTWRNLGLPIFHQALRNVYGHAGFDLVTLYQQLYFGPVCSGAPWHFHQDAWNHLVYGSKLWWLKLPSTPLYSKQPPYQPHGEHNGHVQCIQRAGETLFVPRQWSHQTLNADIAVGFALEVRVGQG